MKIQNVKIKAFVIKDILKIVDTKKNVGFRPKCSYKHDESDMNLHNNESSEVISDLKNAIRALEEKLSELKKDIEKKDIEINKLKVNDDQNRELIDLLENQVEESN